VGRQLHDRFMLSRISVEDFLEVCRDLPWRMALTLIPHGSLRSLSSLSFFAGEVTYEGATLELRQAFGALACAGEIGRNRGTVRYNGQLG